MPYLFPCPVAKPLVEYWYLGTARILWKCANLSNVVFEGFFNSCFCLKRKDCILSLIHSLSTPGFSRHLRIEFLHGVYVLAFRVYCQTGSGHIPQNWNFPNWTAQRLTIQSSCINVNQRKSVLFLRMLPQPDQTWSWCFFLSWCTGRSSRRSNAKKALVFWAPREQGDSMK